MKAPDKIYVETGGYDKRRDSVVGYAFDSYSESQPNEIEYIRKDAILEWAKEYKKAIEVNGDENDAYTRGEYSAINSLIDKINSL